jgi:Right handed beta helix region
MRAPLAFLSLALAVTPLLAQSAERPFLVRETGLAYSTLQDAVDAVGDGAGTILVAPGRYRQCAVQEAGAIAYVAARPGEAILEGKACEEKAALVLGGRSARVEGLIFQNVRVPDANGAGIRLEAGDLVVNRTVFRNGENGILAANDHEGTIRIERSTFSGLGRCPEDEGCSHAIYNSGSGTLIVARSRFERGTGGHYVKSRAARIEVTDSSFDDASGRGTNYMIDLPWGASGTIARNIFVQGRDKENYSALIAIAAEGEEHPSDGLVIANNDASLAPGMAAATVLVADFSGDALRLGPNRLGPRIARYERR